LEQLEVNIILGQARRHAEHLGGQRHGKKREWACERHGVSVSASIKSLREGDGSGSSSSSGMPCDVTAPPDMIALYHVSASAN
jgi:hypothetical protein